MPKLNLSADEVLTTTRAVRKRMDFDKPIELDTITECLEVALQAPTGSNGQQWEWMVVTDPEKIAAISALYQTGFGMYLEMEGSVKTIYKGDEPVAAGCGFSCSVIPSTPLVKFLIVSASCGSPCLFVTVSVRTSGSCR